MPTLTVSVINLSMRSPHNEARYQELWRALYRRRKSVKIWGDFVGLIGNMKIGRDGKIRGDFYKYFDIDAVRNWLNTQTEKAALEEEIKKISIPEHLKPHFELAPYFFDPKAHKLFVVTEDVGDNLSPAHVKKIISQLAKSPSIIDKFGEIGVVVEPEKSALDSIFAMPRINRLEISFLNAPNPGDDLEEDENNVMERMERQNIGRQLIILSAADNKGVKPDEKTQKLAAVAESNGSVKATGRTAGAAKNLTLSTTDIPMSVKLKYSDVESKTAVFDTAIEMLRDKLRRRPRANQ